MKDRQRRDDWNHSRTGFFGIPLLVAVAVIFLLGSAIGGFAEAGDLIIVTAGHTQRSGGTDMIRVITL